MAVIDEKLFRAWQSGDAGARDEAWVLLWKALYKFAINVCRRFSQDDFTAKSRAADAFNRTIEELDKRIRTGKVKWKNEELFSHLVIKHLKRRCLDQFRRPLKEQKRTAQIVTPTSSEEEVGGILLSRLISSEDSPEALTLNVDNARAFVCQLAAIRETCRRQARLVEFIRCIEECLKQCLAEIVPPDEDSAAKTGEELLEIAARAGTLNSLEISQRKMNEFIMRSLKIDRNRLDLLWGRLRKELELRVGRLPRGRKQRKRGQK
jgi:hypothetical protein